jgi:hypothetical protein
MEIHAAVVELFHAYGQTDGDLSWRPDELRAHINVEEVRVFCATAVAF